MLSKVLQAAGLQSQEERDAKLYNDLLRHEAKIGSKVFGKTPKGIRREFFCLDQYTWIWYEEWKDKSGQRRSRTTRYQVRQDSIVKIQDGGSYIQLSDSEVGRFYEAVLAYERKVKRELYQLA